MADPTIREQATGNLASLQQGWPLRKPRQMGDTPGADNPSSVVRPDMPPTSGFTLGHPLDSFLNNLAADLTFARRK